MSWRPLERFREPGIAKLGNLRRAMQHGLLVPQTQWSLARHLDPATSSPPEGTAPPWIIRSASPTEDTDAGTRAGQFTTRVVPTAGLNAFRAALADVWRSLPRDAGGEPLGAVFVQPLLCPESGGVAFFDGFAYECTSAMGGNQSLTSGLERGEVRRGQIRRGEAFSSWLLALARCFRAELRGGALLDIEFARDGDRFTLLQARPARFPLRADPLLSLANHREILGEAPSPWIVSALEAAGADALDYFAEIDPEVGRWGQPYAVALAGRAWLNFSFFFRLMDHWGLPRTFVTEGVGGDGEGPLDARIDWRRMLWMSPRLLRLQLMNLRTIQASGRALRAFERRVAGASSLAELFEASVQGLALALRTNFALNGALTGVVRLRRALGIRGRARVRTEEMMESYEALRGLEGDALASALDAWLTLHGHRGPLESDPARPRFAELRELLLADLARPAAPGPASAPAAVGRGGLLFALDRRRESFRDDLMRAWRPLREGILAAARAEGYERAEDVFLATSADIAAGRRVDAESARAQHARLIALELPNTALRSQIELALQRASGAKDGAQDGAEAPAHAEHFAGVALWDGSFEGKVYRAGELVSLLEAERRAGHTLVDLGTVLVVRALEPSWAVVFGRVGAVVTELGGELSHASILLREAGKPAIVNCAGAFAGLLDGELVRLDGARGLVERVSPAAPVAAGAT